MRNRAEVNRQVAQLGEQLFQPHIGPVLDLEAGGGRRAQAVPVPLAPLPIAVQIIAAPWREDVALRIAHALEAQGVVAAPRPAL